MNFKSERKCEECTLCCEGWLIANVHGRITKPGSPCHFLGKNCTIYKDRPYTCIQYKCVWLDDQNHFIPEWMKPNLSNVIITKRSWGKDNKNFYWVVIECGKIMRSDVLHWLITFCEKNRIDLEYRFNNDIYRRGSREFHEFMENVTNRNEL